MGEPGWGDQWEPGPGMSRAGATVAGRPVEAVGGRVKAGAAQRRVAAKAQAEPKRQTLPGAKPRGPGVGFGSGGRPPGATKALRSAVKEELRHAATKERSAAWVTEAEGGEPPRSTAVARVSSGHCGSG